VHFTLDPADGNLGAGSGHPHVLDQTGVGVGTILHLHPTHIETSSSAGLVLHRRVTRWVPEKSTTIFSPVTPAAQPSLEPILTNRYVPHRVFFDCYLSQISSLFM
jgi:hypothetical protein